MVARSALTAWEQIRDDPRRFVRHLTIEDKENRKRELDPLWPDQQVWLDALVDHRWVIAVKPRQVGFTTITAAFLWWKALTSSRALRVLHMVHEAGAQKRLAKMQRVFARNMPRVLRPPIVTDNREELELGHNGSGFHRLLAGGSGQGRAWTYTDLHATEMSKWRSRTAANSSPEGSTANETWGSALATIHDPDAHVVVESTGAGPFGLFYQLYQQSLEDPAWYRVFVPWNRDPNYRRSFSSERERRKFEDSLDDLERKLAKEHDLSLEQLHWRRWKITTAGMTLMGFRREFPITSLEPFMLSESAWFDQETLAVMAQFIPALGRQSTTYRVFHPYDPTHRYVLCCDTAGGVGGDESVIHIIRDDLLHCAIWTSRWASPQEQALQCSRIGAVWGRPLAIIERNKYGVDVLEEVAKLGGVRLWKNRDGKDFHTSGGNARISHKRSLFVHAREIIDGQQTVICDELTLAQASKIVEKRDGLIEASGDGNDDRIMAYALGLWAARDIQRGMGDMVEDQRAKLRQIASLPDRWAHGTR